jgi:hypothetical protein
LDETFATAKWTQNFNSLKEIDVAFVKQQIDEAILIDRKSLRQEDENTMISSALLKV